MNRLLNRSGSVIRLCLLPLLLFLVISVAAVGCGDDEGDKTTTPTVSAPAASSSSGQDGSVPGDSGGPAVDDDTATGADADGADADADGPTVVNTTDTYGPCVDGMQEVTHYTEYSDGTAASSIAMVPCSGDIEPVEP